MQISRNVLILFLTLAFSTLTVARADEFGDQLKSIQWEWADINYQQPEKTRARAFEQLIEKNQQFVSLYPDRPEPKVWLGICLSSYAGALGGIKSLTRALPAVKRAKATLEEVDAANATVLDGAALTTLGVLYAETPGWPIGFGNKDKARDYFEKALSVNPDGLDSNYFYGKFLLDEKQYEQAIGYFEKSLKAAPREDRPVADQGRKNEARVGLETARAKS